MGKILIIKGADFSENAITPTPTPTPTNKCTPTTVFNVGWWNYKTGKWTTPTSDAGTRLGRNSNPKRLCVVANKNYTINNPLKGMMYDVVFLNANKEQIGYIGGGTSHTTTDLTLTTPSNCSYFCFNLYTGNYIDSNPPAVQINGITVTGATTDALVYEE